MITDTLNTENTEPKNKDNFWEKTKKVWNWLDGKKTTIGYLSLLLSQAFPSHTTAYYVLTAISILCGTTGVIHKFNKGELFKHKHIIK